MKNFNQKVYEIVRLIPKGTVMNYGQIARLTGSSMASRAVGYALHALPDPDVTPWQRVVYKDGSLPLGNSALQCKLLKAEGIKFTADKKVDMKKHNLSLDEVEMLMGGF